MTKPHPTILVGGGAPAAARRAARLRLPMMPMNTDPRLPEAYYDEAKKIGFEGGFVMVPEGPTFLHVTDDPDKAWAELGKYLLYETSVYASWQLPGQSSHVHSHATTLDELRAEGMYLIVSPDECVEVAKGLGPMDTMVLHPLSLLAKGPLPLLTARTPPGSDSPGPSVAADGCNSFR